MKKKCRIVMLATDKAEIWKDILGYEGYYKISSLGNVVTLNRTVYPPNKNAYIRKGRFLTKSTNNYGYKTVGLTINGKTKTCSIHRLIAIHFIPNPENKPCINHIDGVKSHNYINNIEWVTYSENSQHSVDNNLSDPKYPVLIGESNGRSLLTELQVSEIRNKYVPFKYSANKLAKKYNVSRACIEHIINYRSWKKVVK